MNKRLLLVLGLQLVLLKASAQSESSFLRQAFLRSAIAYVPINRVQDDVRNRELTWNNQVGISIFSFLDFGIQASYIEVWGNTIDRNKFYSAGAFVNYRLTPKRKFNIFMEGSYSRGNYCPNGGFDEDPEKREVSYLGIGPGLDYLIFRDKLHISAAIILQNVISCESSYNFGRLGLTYTP